MVPRLVSGHLLEMDSDLKVVHLVRDPRGVLNSRQALGWYQNDFDKQIEFWCNDMNNEADTYSQLAAKYPTR